MKGQSSASIVTPSKNLIGVFNNNNNYNNDEDENEVALELSAKKEKEGGKSPSWVDVQRRFIGSTSPAAKDISRINSLLAKERKRLSDLEAEHSDLLELAAQQEVEIATYRQQLSTRLGVDALGAVEEEARRAATEKYGSYIDFRNNFQQIDG